jgi:hypothetical protein
LRRKQGKKKGIIEKKGRKEKKIFEGKRKGIKKGIIVKKERGEKKEEYNEGKIEGEWKRKDSGKKGKYLGGDKEAGNLQK